MRGQPPIYLDFNATTPLHPAVLSEMIDCSRDAWANASSVHWYGRSAKERIEQGRQAIAKVLRVHPRDLLFVSGGTEANNLGLFDAPALVTSELEHPSVVRVARELERRGVLIRWVAVEPTGQISLDSLSHALVGLPSGAVVAVQAVNHETGVIQPLEQVASLARAAGAWVHVDAVQALGKLAPTQYLHGESYAIAAHKISGPKGIGVLAWNCGRPSPRPLLLGGDQQRGFRPGTLDPIAVTGFAAALGRLGDPETSRAHLALMRDGMESALADLSERNVPPGTPRLGHVSSLFVPGWRADELVAALDVEGLCVSSGSACSAGTAEPSQVIGAMLGRERAAGTIRISLGETTTETQIERAVHILRRVIGRASRR